MSTKATVHFQRNGTTEAIIYRPCDGYPDGLGSDLSGFLHGLPTNARTDEPGALAALFVLWQASHTDADSYIVQKDPECIEYRYLVNCDNQDIPEVEVDALDE